MARLDDILTVIHNRENAYFDLARDWDKLLDLIEEVAFSGEVLSGSEAYLQFLIQVKQCNSILSDRYKDDIKELFTLEPQDAIEFYKTKQLTHLKEFVTDTSVHMYINLEKKVVRCFIGRNEDFDKSAKDNYGKLFNMQPKYLDSKVPVNAIRIVDIARETDERTVKVLNNLIELLNYGRKNRIKMLDGLVDYPHAMYWGVDERKVNTLTDEEVLETQRAEYVKLPVPHKKIQSLAYDDQFLVICEGPVFETLNFATNGLVRSYETEKGAKDVFYSIIDYINNKHNAGITKVEKHYFSNRWPIAKTEEEANENAKKLTKFEVSVSKVIPGEIVVKLEVWNKGIVYELITKNYFETPDVVHAHKPVIDEAPAVETEAPYDEITMQKLKVNS